MHQPTYRPLRRSFCLPESHTIKSDTTIEWHLCWARRGGVNLPSTWIMCQCRSPANGILIMWSICKQVLYFLCVAHSRDNTRSRGECATNDEIQPLWMSQSSLLVWIYHSGFKCVSSSSVGLQCFKWTWKKTTLFISICQTRKPASLVDLTIEPILLIQMFYPT